MPHGMIVLTPPDVATEEGFSLAGRKVAISFADRPAFLPGRRSWVKYRELGVTEASGGAMRAQVLIAEAAENKPTGWHFHQCEMQFLFIQRGALHLAFGPDQVYRLEAGDSIMIPGGVIHTELGEAEGAELIEVTVPASIGTEMAVPPWGDVEVDFTRFRKWSEAA